MGKEESDDSHSIINEWGGVPVVPRSGEGDLWAKHGQPANTYNIRSFFFFMSPELSLSLACLYWNTEKTM
jgi:hypothetical protein